jgi:hypothetical protein
MSEHGPSANHLTFHILNTTQGTAATKLLLHEKVNAFLKTSFDISSKMASHQAEF